MVTILLKLKNAIAYVVRSSMVRSTGPVILIFLAFWTFSQVGFATNNSTYHVGVWFFTLWNSKSRSLQVKQSQKVYGRADPWGGVRDYAEGHGLVPILDPTTHQPVNYSNRRPLLGFYDLMDPNIVSKEIDEAASKGIEFFALYWYFNAENGEEENISAPTSLFFTSPARSKMKFLLGTIALSDDQTKKVSLEAWREKTIPQLIRYMKSDAYYRVDGRPLLVAFSINFNTVSDEISAYDALRRATKLAMGIDPLIVRMLPAEAKYDDMNYFQNRVHPDGFTCFAHSITGNPEPYQQYIDEWIPKMRAQITTKDKNTIGTSMFIPCGSIGMDPRPWFEIGRGAPDGPNSMRFTANTTPALFRQHLQSLRDFVDQHRALTKGVLTLYAWNEWGEAAADIEPSAAQGYIYADVVREVFALKPRLQRPLTK
jgi:Glycosyltransferase WbsX